MDHLYRNNAEDAKRIRALLLSDYVRFDDNIDDGTEPNGNYVEPRELYRGRYVG